MTQEDQKHPQEKQDRDIVNKLLQEGQNPHNLAELARLRIRYRDFPGARAMQRDLDLLLKQWQLTEEQLYAQTRQLHATRQVYQRLPGEQRQDWS